MSTDIVVVPVPDVMLFFGHEIYQPPGEMHRVTCDGKSGAYTVRVRTGVYAGRWVQTRANGVTVS